ncbi:hypothetical protein BWQ96_06047 [Gracilariopsis chorda]|uniref:Uncharacterized protein n=1 Tax=Gracilariopsis chorda TaxID=448386 RepID=A0A2V3IR33_9FLOR|nr:hypothetical protein BWQ96_06047 [Gracilariopsis chorda]|eukprot:PXF44187.1 hypothetical protein BWQ96_06047 [Gracilariopsis chorda]
MQKAADYQEAPADDGTEESLFQGWSQCKSAQAMPTADNCQGQSRYVHT